MKTDSKVSSNQYTGKGTVPDGRNIDLTRVREPATQTVGHAQTPADTKKSGKLNDTTGKRVTLDQIADTRVPDMTRPVRTDRTAQPAAKASGRKPVTIPSNRSHEMSSLIGRTTRLTLREKHVVKSMAFISNKGGVGKTHISSNMAFNLSRAGKKVLLIDLDLSNSDVTSKLGFYCENTVIDLLQGKRDVRKMIYNTPLGFDLIAGEPGNFKLANLTTPQKRRFIRAFGESASDYDFVLYDLSAGLGATTLDFALAQDYQVVVTTPQDIVSGYGCVKATFYRFQQIERRMAEHDSDYRMHTAFRPFMVMNQVPDLETGRELFSRINHVAKQNLGHDREFQLDMQFLGFVTSDPLRIRESELRRILYSSQHGSSRTGQCFNFLVHNLMQYRDPEALTFTSKMKRFVDIFMKSVGETKYAQ